MTVATSIDKLPILKDGHVRVIHFTDKDTAVKILSKGLKHEGINNIAESYADELKAVYHTQDAKTNTKAVILDIPAEEHVKHIESQGTLPAKFIVGVITPPNPSVEYQ